MEGKMLTTTQNDFLNQLMNHANERAQELGIDAKIDVRPDGLRVRLPEDEGTAKQLFESYSWKFGYPKDWFGKTFIQQGAAYRIVGVKPTAEKNCLKIVRQSDKKEFVCPVGFCSLPKTAAA
jgi:hypothetical protein